MRNILNSYTATELRKHISTYNKSLGAVKGYSKMNKTQLIDLMTKKENINKFKSIKMKVKTDKKEVKKTTTTKTTPKTTTKTTTKTQPKEKGSLKMVKKIIDEDMPKVKNGKDLTLVLKKMDNSWDEFKKSMNATGFFFKNIEKLIQGKLNFQTDEIVLDQVLRKLYPEGYKKGNKKKLEEEAKEEAKIRESDEFKKGMEKLNKEQEDRRKKFDAKLKKGPPKETTTKSQPIKNPYKELDEYIKNEVSKFTDWAKLEDALKNKIETLFLNKNLPDTVMPFRDRIKKDTPKPTYFNVLRNKIRDNLNKKLREDRNNDADNLLRNIISKKFKLKGETGRTFSFLKDYWKRLSPEVKKNTEEIIKMYNDKNLKTVSIKSKITKMNGQYLPYMITRFKFYGDKESKSKANRANALSDYIKENSKIKKLPFSQLEDSTYRNLEDIVNIGKKE